MFTIIFEKPIDKPSEMWYNKYNKEREVNTMRELKMDEINIKKGFGRKVYIYGNYAIIGKFYSSKWYNPFDWYLAKII